MAQSVLSSSTPSYFSGTILPDEIKIKTIEFAVFSAQDPTRRGLELGLVCKEWHQISETDDMALKLIVSGCKVKEVILKRLVIKSDWEPALVRAWSALFQQKFDLLNCSPIDDIWESDLDEGEQAQQAHFQSFKGWLCSLEVSHRELIRAADFSKKDLSHSQRLEILEKLPELTSLTFDETDLSYGNKIQDGQISALGSLCPKLEEIRLGKVRLSETGITALFSAFPLLKSLHLDHLNHLVSEDSLPGFFGMLPSRMVTLVMQCTLGITSEGFLEFTKRAADLKVLDLSGCKNFPAQVLVAFICHCPQLESLVLDSQYEVTDALLMAIGEQCKHLKHFSYGHCSKLTSDGIEAFKEKYPHL
jgi:hypothetical protein